MSIWKCTIDWTVVTVRTPGVFRAWGRNWTRCASGEWIDQADEMATESEARVLDLAAEKYNTK